MSNKDKPGRTGYIGKYNLREQRDLNLSEARFTNKTPKGERWYIPRWRCSVEIKVGDTIKKYIERILQARHSKSGFGKATKLEKQNDKLKQDIILDARKASIRKAGKY